MNRSISHNVQMHWFNEHYSVALASFPELFTDYQARHIRDASADNHKTAGMTVKTWESETVDTRITDKIVFAPVYHLHARRIHASKPLALPPPKPVVELPVPESETYHPQVK